jgi:hypothetical protein
VVYRKYLTAANDYAVASIHLYVRCDGAPKCAFRAVMRREVYPNLTQ